ncbi:MAG: response regulator transcription factor [Clostridia bacterium]|nr:response regulator transcription factor [Clostridia bacterium]
MKIGICDDSLKFCEDLKKIAKAYAAQNHLSFSYAIYDSGEAFFADKEPCDILFLDIELGDVTGIEVLKYIKRENLPTIVLVVTAYSKYIDEAMDFSILRYIEKPVEQSRVFHALNSALERIDEKYIVLDDLTTHTKVKVAFKDIIYAETKMRKILVRTTGGTYTLKEGFKGFKSALSASYFAEPHYSYIVNMNYIKCFKRTEIIVDVNGEEKKIHVSGDKQHALRQKYSRFLGEDK